MHIVALKLSLLFAIALYLSPAAGADKEGFSSFVLLAGLPLQILEIEAAVEMEDGKMPRERLVQHYSKGVISFPVPFDENDPPEKIHGHIVWEGDPGQLVIVDVPVHYEDMMTAARFLCSEVVPTLNRCGVWQSSGQSPMLRLHIAGPKKRTEFFFVFSMLQFVPKAPLSNRQDVVLEFREVEIPLSDVAATTQAGNILQAYKQEVRKPDAQTFVLDLPDRTVPVTLLKVILTDVDNPMVLIADRAEIERMGRKKGKARVFPIPMEALKIASDAVYQEIVEKSDKRGPVHLENYLTYEGAYHEVMVKGSSFQKRVASVKKSLNHKCVRRIIDNLDHVDDYDDLEIVNDRATPDAPWQWTIRRRSKH